MNNIGSFALSKPGQFYSTSANFVIFRTIFWYNFVRKMLPVNDKVWAAKIECQGFHSNSCNHFKKDRKVVSKIFPTWDWRTLIGWLCIRLQRSGPRTYRINEKFFIINALTVARSPVMKSFWVVAPLLCYRWPCHPLHYAEVVMGRWD